MQFLIMKLEMISSNTKLIKSPYLKEPGHAVLISRKCYQDKGAEENKNNGGGGGRRDNRSQDRRDGYNKSGHDAFKKKEKVKSLLLRGDM